MPLAPNRLKAPMPTLPGAMSRPVGGAFPGLPTSETSE